MSVTRGFSLVELMVSVAILTLLSTATVFSLNRTRQTEELRASARMLEGDLRSIQTRALAGENVRVCPTAAGPKVCEAENPSADMCTGPCDPTVAAHYGVHVENGSAAVAYDVFADLDGDWRLSSDREVIVRRMINPLGGAGNVIVRTISTDVQGSLQTLDLGVSRQRGTMRANACGDQGLPVCDPSEPTIVHILLSHEQSARDATVDIDTRVGRISLAL